MNKTKQAEIQKKLENIFSDLDIKYQQLNFQDDDLNYELEISLNGKLKPLNYLPCIKPIQIFKEKADRKNRQGMLYSLGIKGVMNP